MVVRVLRRNLRNLSAGLSGCCVCFMASVGLGGCFAVSWGYVIAPALFSCPCPLPPLPHLLAPLSSSCSSFLLLLPPPAPLISSSHPSSYSSPLLPPPSCSSLTPLPRPPLLLLIPLTLLMGLLCMWYNKQVVHQMLACCMCVHVVCCVQHVPSYASMLHVYVDVCYYMLSNVCVCMCCMFM